MTDINRDHRVDWIRAICSLSVILAHVGAPFAINQIRTFDVVSLVFISGVSLAYSKKKKYGEYIWQRIKKLLFPTYIVIAFVFLLSYMACSVLHIKQLYSKSQIIRSFLFLNNGSMGYVWIVRIYLCIAVLSPLLKFVAQKLDSRWKLFAFLAVSVPIGYGMYYIGLAIQDGWIKDFYVDYIFSTFVYSIIVIFGTWNHANKYAHRNMLIGTLVVFIAMQVVMCLNGTGFAPGIYKFPPRLYYVVYGLLCTYILYAVLPNRKVVPIEWISKNSFMIYLFHIIVLRIYGLVTKIPAIKFMDDLWIIKYLVVTCGAIIMVAVWNKMNAEWARRKQ